MGFCRFQGERGEVSFCFWTKLLFHPRPGAVKSTPKTSTSSNYGAYLVCSLPCVSFLLLLMLHWSPAGVPLRCHTTSCPSSSLRSVLRFASFVVVSYWKILILDFYYWIFLGNPIPAFFSTFTYPPARPRQYTHPFYGLIFREGNWGYCLPLPPKGLPFSIGLIIIDSSPHFVRAFHAVSLITVRVPFPWRKETKDSHSRTVPFFLFGSP